MNPQTREARKAFLKHLQTELGYSRTEARRALYGDTWRTKHATKRSQQAQWPGQRARSREAAALAEEPAQGRTDNAEETDGTE